MNLRAGLVIGVVAAQLVIPVYALVHTEHRPGRFGWHMYAALKQMPELEVVSATGTRRLRLPAILEVGWRPEIDYERRLPEYLCRRFPDAEAVRFVRDTPRQRIHHRC